MGIRSTFLGGKAAGVDDEVKNSWRFTSALSFIFMI
jgi:hypothetical protein